MSSTKEEQHYNNEDLKLDHSIPHPPSSPTCPLLFSINPATHLQHRTISFSSSPIILKVKIKIKIKVSAYWFGIGRNS
jgi:hypothetical protein